MASGKAGLRKSLTAAGSAEAIAALFEELSEMLSDASFFGILKER